MESEQALLDDAVAAIVDDDEVERQLVVGRGPQRLDRIHRRAVAGIAHHRARRIGEADADRGRQAPADAAGSQRVITVAVAMRPQADDLARRGEALIDQDRIVGHRFHDLQRQPVRVDRRSLARLRDLLDQRLALRRPILRCERREPLLRARLQRASAGLLQCWHQRAQRLLDVGFDRDLGAIVAGEIAVDQPDLHDREPVRQRIDLAVDRHPQGIAAERDQQIMRRQHVTRDLLQPRDRAHEARALRQEMRTIRRRRLPRRAA